MRKVYVIRDKTGVRFDLGSYERTNDAADVAFRDLEASRTEGYYVASIPLFGAGEGPEAPIATQRVGGPELRIVAGLTAFCCDCAWYRVKGRGTGYCCLDPPVHARWVDPNDFCSHLQARELLHGDQDNEDQTASEAPAAEGSADVGSDRGCGQRTQAQQESQSGEAAQDEGRAEAPESA